MISRFLNMLRTRRRRPPCRDIWRAGDLGICVKGDWSPAHDFDPKLDDLVRVAAVGRDRAGTCMLELVGKPAPWRWEASGFRKIVPTHDAAAATFCAEIRSAAKAPAQKEPA